MLNEKNIITGLSEKHSILKQKNYFGRWKLSYNVTNEQGESAFGESFIDGYMHPLYKKWFLPVIGGIPAPGFHITKTITVFDPDNNEEHQGLVEWLLAHPKVMVEGLDIDEEILNSKKAANKIKLINIDYVDVSEMEDEEIIDKIVGRLTLDTGQFALGLEKLRYICAAIGKPYKDSRYINNAKTEKTILRNKVKRFVKESKGNAKKVESVIQNLDAAKMEYIVQVLMEHGKIVQTGGYLKYEGKIMGVNYESILKEVRTNPILYQEMEKQVINLI